MHILIITDLEGISGVDSIDMIDAKTDGYQKAREFLMADTNAAIDGAFAGGADKVTVLDGHGGGSNFIEDALDKRADIICSQEIVSIDIRSLGIDAVYSIGCHAMAGTENAFLDHTQNSKKWFDYRINGNSCGEIAQQAAWAGSADIPLVMVTGDRAACLEAEAFIPDVVTAFVKTSKVRNYADCLPQKESLDKIRCAAKAAISRVNGIAPLKITLPAIIELTLYRSDYCDEVMSRCPQLVRSGRTLTRHLDKITCYRDLTRF